jgi:hypothetical protein
LLYFLLDGVDAQDPQVHQIPTGPAGLVMARARAYLGSSPDRDHLVYKETGKGLDTQICHVLKFRDGKLMSFQQYANTAQLQDVQGAR